MKKTFKKFSLVFVAVVAFFAGTKAFAANTRDQSAQDFTYDYELKLELGDELTKTEDGKNFVVPITGYADATYTTNVNLSGKDAVHYRVSEISLELYNTMLAYQNEIDKLDGKALSFFEILGHNQESDEPIFQITVFEGKENNPTKYNGPKVIEAKCINGYSCSLEDVIFESSMKVMRK